MTTKTAPVLDRVRYLLNVWVRACEPPGGRADLPEICVQTFSYGIDQLDHVLPVTRQRLLHRAVFEQRPDYWILHRERLQLPVARRIRHRNAETVERVGQLLVRIEIDI